MDISEKLLAIEEIKLLKARYFRYCDGKEWGKFEQLFVPNLVCEAEDNGSILIHGAREFAEASRKFLGSSVSIHHGHTPEIEILGPATARGIWVMQDILTWENGDPINGFKRIMGWGHYHENYSKVSDGWRIATWKLTRVRLERSM